MPADHPILLRNPIPAPVLHDRDAELKKHTHGLLHGGAEEPIQKVRPLGGLEHTGEDV